MLLSKDLWLTLNEKQRLEKLSEALVQLKEIDTRNSELKTKPDHGRLGNVKKELEAFVIRAVSWETDRQLQRHY